MTDKRIYGIAEIIKEISSKYGVSVNKLILFGSRARNDARSDSDFDFIAVTDYPVSHQKKMEIWLMISRSLCKQNVTADVLFKSESEFDKDRTNKGKITYYAVKEGVRL